MNGTDRDLILKNINAALKSKKLYPPGHPSITAPAKKTHQLVTDALKSGNNIMIGLVQDAIVFEEDMVTEGEKLFPEIILYMKEKNVDALIFEKGVSEKEMTAVLDILCGPRMQGPELQNELHAREVLRITLKSAPVAKRNVLEIYNGAVDTVKNVMGEIRAGKIPKSEPVENIVTEITETVLSDRNAIIGLTMIKNYDNYLYNHSVNVSILALSLGRELNLGKDELHTVGVAALLHDIGKTGVAEDIIRKPGGLSSEEWEKVKEHPLLGSRITKRMDGLDEMVGRLIYEHHIKFDASGYPQIGSRPHPLSQIITISDAYDALTTVRVYQQPHSPVEAIKVMSNFSGRHFNPDTLKAFINMIGLYPIGTMVRLSTGEVGIVTKVNQENAGCPAVKIVYDKDGNALGEPNEIDLSTIKGRDIVSTVNPVTTDINVVGFFEKEAATSGPVV